MDLPELSSTPSGAHRERTLVNALGVPLKINLQAVELGGRPKLVRMLKSSGALVTSNAKEAAIILVDSTTESGKRLIRTWGRDASKVVLEYTWARESVDAGRPLLETDNWGGAMTIDDGKPVTIDGVVVDEDELEVEALVTKSPLPTPRVTPVDSTSQHTESTIIERFDPAQSESAASNIIGPPLPVPAISQPITVGITLPKEPTTDIPSTQSPLPLPATPSPYPQPTQFVPPSQYQNTYGYAPFTTQQPYPSSQPHMVPGQAFPLQHQTHVIHPPSAPLITSSSAQSSTMHMSSSATSVNGMNLHPTNLAAIMTIMDVMRYVDQSSRFSQNQLPTSQSPNDSNTFAPTERPTTPERAASTSTFPPAKKFDSRAPSVNAQDHSLKDNTASQNHDSGPEAFEDRSAIRKLRIKLSRSSPDEVSTMPVSRKRPPAAKPTSPPPKRSRKGKGQVVSASEPPKVDEPVEFSDDSYSSTSPPPRPRNIIARKQHGQIFLSESGQPLRFFVQVDLHGRHTVVANIKKNKGMIVNNIADADYSILFTRSDTFQGLLSEAAALGKTPILAAFVADCVEEGALLDETDYIVDSGTKVKALSRGRPSAFSTQVETTETSPHPAEAVKPGSSVAGKKLGATSTSKKLKKTPKSSVEGKKDSETSRSPTPPAATTRQLLKSGKYLFTEVEDEYFLRLAKHHLACDPTISNTALVHKLHKKMPHHTVASWGAHIDKKLKGTLEDVRKRANIAKRKRASKAVSQNASLSSVDDSVICDGHILGSTPENTPPSSSQACQEDLERQDFEVITHFFASGGGDDDDDERVWQGLEKHQQCRSASSWPDYYAAHQEQVYSRIEELTKVRVGD